MTTSKKNNNNALETKIKEARVKTENFRGVYLDVTKLRNNHEKYFRARIANAGHDYSLGYFDNAEDAAKAYNKKAKSLFGGEKRAKKMGRWNVV